MKNRFSLILCCLISLSSLTLTVFAQVPFPGPRFTPEQLREKQECDAERRAAAEAEYQRELEIATEKGKQIKLTIRLDSTVVNIPANIEAQIVAYEAGQRRLEEWNRAWRKLEVLELQSRLDKRELETGKSLGNQPKTYGNRIDRLAHSFHPGRVVSNEDAIRELGSPPVVPAMPGRPVEPLMVLELKNTSDQRQRIYPSSVAGKPRHHVTTKVLGDGVQTTIHNMSFANGISYYGNSDPSVDLAPGAIYLIPLNKPGTMFPLYFTKPGVYRLQLVYN